jgi:hypothetical protein
VEDPVDAVLLLILLVGSYFSQRRRVVVSKRQLYSATPQENETNKS